MGEGFFHAGVTDPVAAQPRHDCVRCGEPLGFHWEEQKNQATEAYCGLCRWLLRDPKLGVFLDATRPSDEVLLAAGVPLDWNDRQRAEPVPCELLNVEEWPEVDVVPRIRNIAVAAFLELLSPSEN